MFYFCFSRKRKKKRKV